MLSRTYKIGDQLKVSWRGGVGIATIIKIKENVSILNSYLYYIHYNGWNEKWNEWITNKRILTDNRRNNANLKNEMNKIKFKYKNDIVITPLILLNYVYKY